MKTNPISWRHKLLPREKKTISKSRVSRKMGNYLRYGLALTIMFSSCKKISDENAQFNGSPGKSKTMSTSSATGDEFTIAVMPDTQFYTGEKNDGTRQMFYAQIDWIKANRVAENIVYVAGLGDITDCGDTNPSNDVSLKNRQWNISSIYGYYKLDSILPGLPEGIPYGLTVGNHDQLYKKADGTIANRAFQSPTTKYNEMFGRSHFSSKSYWGTAFTEPGNLQKNDNHYDVFTVNGQKYIVFHIEYDDPTMVLNPDPYDDQNDLIINWVAEKLDVWSDHKAIIVTHSMLNNPGTFSPQGARIYNKVKSHPNVFMMLCGHVSGPDQTGLNDGESERIRTYNGTTIKSFLTDYQGRPFGGGGLMRLYTFSPANDLIRVRTINPYTGIPETDSESEFVRPMYHGFTTTRTSDFDNNGKSQLSIFNSGTWNVQGMSNVNFGASGDIAIPADYNGDGQTEYAYYRPSDQTFNIQGQASVAYGNPGDIPVPGDYQDQSNDNDNDNETLGEANLYKREKADGKVDIAVWRPSTGEWFVKDQTLALVTWGQPEDIPVPADYDGDGKVNFAIYKTAASTWHMKNNTESGFTWGITGDIPVPGDYNGDGKVDVAVFRRSNNTWYIRNQTNTTLTFYLSGDIPVPGDYNGDGKTDMALYRPSTGEVLIYNQTTISTGLLNGKPLNLPYHIRKFFFP